MGCNGRKSNEVCSSFSDVLVQLPEVFRKTMTYDNGSEMAEHKSITQSTGMKVYFAHPYSSWERGTNENTNGLIRQYFPKKRSFVTITQQEIEFVMDRLNNRPRKCLGFKSPNQVFFNHSSAVALKS